MAKTIINVNRHKIAANKKHGEFTPVISVKSGKSNTYAHSIKINGPCVLIYSPYKPLKCGATVWIETESDIDQIIQCPECKCDNVDTILIKDRHLFSHCERCEEDFYQHSDEHGPEICSREED